MHVSAFLHTSIILNIFPLAGIDHLRPEHRRSAECLFEDAVLYEAAGTSSRNTERGDRNRGRTAIVSQPDRESARHRGDGAAHAVGRKGMAAQPDWAHRGLRRRRDGRGVSSSLIPSELRPRAQLDGAP